MEYKTPSQGRTTKAAGKKKTGRHHGKKRRESAKSDESTGKKEKKTWFKRGSVKHPGTTKKRQPGWQGTRVGGITTKDNAKGGQMGRKQKRDQVRGNTPV